MIIYGLISAYLYNLFGMAVLSNQKGIRLSEHDKRPRGRNNIIQASRNDWVIIISMPKYMQVRRLF